MKDNTTRIILILLAALVLLTVYRGRFETLIIAEKNVLHPTPAWELKLEFEAFKDDAIGVYTYLSRMKNCSRFDSSDFRVQLSSHDGIALRPMQRSSYYHRTDTPRKNNDELCAGESMSFSEIFYPPGAEVDSLHATFSLTDSVGNLTSAELDLIKKTKFTLASREKTTDILILAYPILWIAFGVLILAKLTKLIKD